MKQFIGGRQRLVLGLILLGLLGCGQADINPSAILESIAEVAEDSNSQGPVRFVAYSLQDEPRFSGDGWKGYRVALAFKNTTGATLAHTLIPFGGASYVETEEGEVYDAEIVKTRYNEILTNGLSSIDLTKTDYRQTVPLPPDVFVTTEVYSSMGWNQDSWAAVFQVPETLTPTRLIIPGFDPVSLEELSPQVMSQNFQDQGNYESLPTELVNQGSTLAISINQPRLVLDGDQTALAVNLDIENLDVTSNQQVDYSFSLIDSKGKLAPHYRMFCEGSDRDFSLEDTLPVIGPGQLKQGILCFTIGDENPLSYEGDYILAVRIDDLLESFIMAGVSFDDQSLDLSRQGGPAPDTPSQSILQFEEIWWQQGFGLQFKSASFDPGCNGIFGFELVLYYPAGTSTRFDDENLIIKDDLGNSYSEIWWREGQASQNCYAGNYLDDNIEGAGITGFGGRILGEFPPGVTHLTIEVTEFGQVKNAQWKLGVP